MASIAGAEGMSDAQVIAAVDDGGKLVVFEYTISILVMTFKRGSAVHLVRKGESAAMKSLPYTLLTLVAGWWGIPFGPIYSIMCLFTNLSGGRDVTGQFILRRGPE